MQSYSCTLATPDLSGTSSLCGSGSTVLKAYSGTAPSATYVWKNGSAAVGGNSNTYTATSAGTYTVTVTSSGCSKSASATVTASMPTVSLGSAKDICSTPTVTLDAGVSGSGFTYQWSLNSNTISGATSQTYAASAAGTYGVTVSATGCGSQSGTVAVTSSLVDASGASRCGTGTVTLNVNSPASGATYDWYSVQTGGTKVNSGTSYTPTVSNTTTYYVEKVSTGSSCAGITVYDATQNYPGGSVVSYNGEKYTSAYWANPNEYPGKIAGQWNDNGACGGGSSCTRTPVTATVTTGCNTSPTISLAGASKTYGDASFSMAATSNSTGAFTYSITNGTAATITSAGVVTITGAGTVTVTVNQAASGNYNAGSATATITIAKKTLTVTANNASKTYNTANPALTVVYAGFAGSDNASSLATQATATTTATQSSAAGTYPITPAGAVSNNYTYNYVNGTLTITGIAPSISLASATKTYGDASFTIAATSNSTGAFTYSITNGTAATITAGGVVTITGAGSVTVTVNQAAAGNYNAGSTTATINIAKKTLAVKANDASKTYNSANPAFTASYTGFVGNDNASSLTTQPSLTTTATQTSAVGTYAVTVSGAASANYIFTYTSGTLTVTGTTPTITFTNANVGQAGNTVTLAATSNSSGVMSFSVVNGTGSATLANGNKLTLKTAGNVTVTVTIAASGNYAAASATQTIMISQTTTAVDDNTFSASVNVFPNPAAEKLHVGFTLLTHSDVVVELIDIDGGNVVATTHDVFDAGSNEINLALPHLANKIYICKISYEGKTTISKIAVKQ